MMPEQPVRFGDFILCPVNQQLQTTEQNITLEPKVYSVLCYLMTHHQRFVSLEELHQQVWAGRVVSDTAVRRTISKLRAALQDQAETPKYIQSAARRGYRWLAEVEPVATTSSIKPAREPSLTPAHTISDTSVAAAEEMDSPTISARKTLKPWWLAMPLVLLAGLLGWLMFPETEPTWQRLDPLPTIEGEKLALAISPDRNAIVYSSNSMNHAGQELYWHHLESGRTRQLTSGNHQIMWAEYHHDGQSLFYHDYQQGLYQLYRRPISSSGEWLGPAEALLPPQPRMLQLTSIPGTDKLLLSMGQSDAMQIKQLDLISGELQPLTHAVIGNSSDYPFALSADNSMLAYIRTAKAQPHLLTVVQRETGRVLHQQVYPDIAFRLKFYDDEHLLILDDKALTLMHWPSGASQMIESNQEQGGPGLSRFLVRVSEQDWLQSRIVGNVQGFLHQFGPIGDLSNRAIVASLAPGATMYLTATPGQYLMVQRQAALSRLVLQQPDGQSLTLLDVEDANLMIQAVHPDGEQVVLFLHGRPHLFRIPEGQLTALSVRPQLWQSARFEGSGQAVILTYIENAAPVTVRYQLDNGQITPMHQGERVVASLSANDFIVLRDDQHFARVRYGKTELLPIQTRQQFVGSIHLRQNMLFWGETDLKNTWIYRYDLTSGELQQWQADRRQMLQYFDISPDATQWLLRHVPRIDTQIFPAQSRF
ncbi:winged helix-turn-helix domain-containing protein [Alkalimonas mucilaginosa]|uniref:Winged helix-turn-helix domain-containing protein n=1 Tax=Alkalimonas mucilaginosa TaxID=3057676 RepID=A0ABU7JFC8_9GAMM|nr:winged helix-turn-helix domain-containing protein [Alkalimonas sp. MEB004]MEE2024388.1 winged helix-turn-helix domain-containing protein [Alkalimonas sp. MEB004]